MVLVNPGVGGVDRGGFPSCRSGRGLDDTRAHVDDDADLLQFLRHDANDLEAPARAIQPVIGDVLEALAALPDVLLARMSGSGATCFAHL